MYINAGGQEETNPQELGLVPADDPFWGDPAYPYQLQLKILVKSNMLLLSRKLIG